MCHGVYRLAMVGFVAALFAEISSGLPVTAQLEQAPAAIAFTFALFAFASLVPILKVRPLAPQVLHLYLHVSTLKPPPRTQR